MGFLKGMGNEFMPYGPGKGPAIGKGGPYGKG